MVVLKRYNNNNNNTKPSLLTLLSFCLFVFVSRWTTKVLHCRLSVVFVLLKGDFTRVEGVLRRGVKKRRPFERKLATGS